MNAADRELLERVLSPDPPPFALLHRPEHGGRGHVDLLLGEISAPATLAGIPLSSDGAPGPDVLAFVPFRQITERGFEAADDGTPLIAMSVRAHARLPVGALMDRLPTVRNRITGGRFDVSDEEYESTVRRVVADEIGTGEGANFVVRRSYVAGIEGWTTGNALAWFRRLMLREANAYWTFVAYTGDRTLVGASPERHVSLHDGTAVMNPISGTYRYPASGPSLPGVLDFLDDRKEADELYMVVDEELKMMARICDDGVRVIGPYLREMANLAHTEYFIEGRSCRDPRDILRETMFAPTVTGSPLESACRMIRRYEPQGRGYYSGIAALISRDQAGARTLDSAILIRTADVDAAGRLSIGVGATLVRHSQAAAEAAETRAKAATLLAAADDGPGRLADHPRVRTALARRNAGIADFWLSGDGQRHRPDVLLAGRRLLVVDAEDTFTAMIEQQLRSMDLAVTVRRFDQRYSLDGFDAVVLGPGPGDPRAGEHPKIRHLREAVHELLTRRLPFLAVCLSHQVLSHQLGFPLHRRDVPSQGEQREIDLFGRTERVGFYNTYAAHSPDDKVHHEGIGTVEVSRDPTTGEVHALRGPHFASLQFHAESVLTQDGPRILGTLLAPLLRR